MTNWYLMKKVSLGAAIESALTLSDEIARPMLVV